MDDDIVKQLEWLRNEFLEWLRKEFCDVDSVTAIVDVAANEIERLRRLGDTMAYFVRAGDGTEMFAAVHAWQEARRG